MRWALAQGIELLEGAQRADGCLAEEAHIMVVIVEKFPARG